MDYIVYLTRNNVNGKIYIGVHQTENADVFDGYLGCGISKADQSKLLHPKTPIAFAIKKYGFKNFTRSTIKKCQTMEEALALEALIVDDTFIKRPDTYNIALGGGLPPNLSKPVYQYNLNGEFVSEWSSLTQAAKAVGLAPNTICRAVTCHGLAGEYYWTYQKSTQLDLTSFTKLQRKELHAYDEAGNYVRSFKSFTQYCKEFHCSTSNIKRALVRGGRCKGYFLSLEKKASLDISHIVVPAYGKVFQYDLQGNLVGEFGSVKEVATKLHLQETNINSAARQGKPYKQFLWSRGDYPVTMKACGTPTPKMKKVGRYSLDGKLLEVHPSVSDARLKYGSAVIHVLKGIQRQTRGFIFQYL